MENFESQLYEVTEKTLEEVTLRVFRYQASDNPLYKSFLQSLGVQPNKIHSIQSIPFLPISLFKRHDLRTGSWQAETLFLSSGTTDSVPSGHAVRDVQFYLHHASRCFEFFFGDASQYNFMALLPSYLERGQSSLVAMMDFFIKKSKSPHSGFYLHNTEALLSDLQKAKKDTRKTILWGVTYALLDLAHTHKPDLSHCHVFETGGMKGTREEITRMELHQTLCNGLNVPVVYSEYGMTELFSQCYTRGKDRFYCPPWIRVLIRDLSDPFEKGLQNETGGINVIDLANWHTISFIETEDLGKAHSDGGFEVLGRIDNSDVRGCNLLMSG